MPNSPLPLCESLRSLRINAGLTQQQIADYLQCSRSTYTYYETGKTEASLLILENLAEFYGFPTFTFFKDILGDKEEVRSLVKGFWSLREEEASFLAILRGLDGAALHHFFPAFSAWFRDSGWSTGQPCEGGSKRKQDEKSTGCGTAKP